MIIYTYKKNICCDVRRHIITTKISLYMKTYFSLYKMMYNNNIYLSLYKKIYNDNKHFFIHEIVFFIIQDDV